MTVNWIDAGTMSDGPIRNRVVQSVSPSRSLDELPLDHQAVNIPFTVQKNLKLSTWAFDEPNMLAGESGAITGCVVAHPTNPLYNITTASGKEFVCHRDRLVEVGALEPIGE